MISNDDKVKIKDVLIEILQNAKRYVSKTRNESCFLSAYQLAVLLNKNHKALIRSSNCPSNIGGKGEGEQSSLSQYIASILTEDSRVEIGFFNTEGLEQFSFKDEKNILSQPSNECFSMFRYNSVMD